MKLETKIIIFLSLFFIIICSSVIVKSYKDTQIKNDCYALNNNTAETQIKMYQCLRDFSVERKLYAEATYYNSEIIKIDQRYYYYNLMFVKNEV